MKFPKIKLPKLRYEYAVFYKYLTTDGQTGDGYRGVRRPYRINSADEVEELRKAIIKWSGKEAIVFEKIVFTGWKLLNIKVVWE